VSINDSFEIQGNTKEYKGIHIQGNTREYRRIQGNTGEYKRIKGNTGEYKRIQGNTRECKGFFSKFPTTTPIIFILSFRGFVKTAVLKMFS